MARAHLATAPMVARGQNVNRRRRAPTAAFPKEPCAASLLTTTSPLPPHYSPTPRLNFRCRGNRMRAFLGKAASAGWEWRRAAVHRSLKYQSWSGVRQPRASDAAACGLAIRGRAESWRGGRVAQKSVTLSHLWSSLVTFDNANAKLYRGANGKKGMKR
jgi:hypothetical protein